MSGLLRRCGWLLPLLWVGCGGEPFLQGALPGLDGGVPDAGNPDGGDPLAGLPPAHLRYFVSPAGDDAQDGLAPERAWRTVAHVNGMSFVPADQILFARGAGWTESLVVPSDGATGQPLVFASYGNGDKPRFYGSDALDPAGFQATPGTSLYTTEVSGDVNCVVAGDAFLVPVDAGQVPSTPGSYALSGGTLTLNPGTDPRTGAVRIGVCRRVDAVYTNGHNHLLLRDLVTDGTAKPDDGYGFRVENSTDVQLQTCEAYRAGKHHFGTINSTGFVGTGLYAAYGLPGQGAGGSSAFVTFGDGTGMPDQTSEWRDCTFDHTEDLASPGTHLQAYYMHGPAVASVLVHNLTTHGGLVVLNNGDNPSAPLRMEGGWIDDGLLRIYGDAAVVDGVKITGSQGVVEVVGTHAVLQNLLLVGNNLAGQWYQTAVLFRNSGGTLRFSTIVVDPAAPGSNTCVAFASTSAPDPYSEGTDTRLYANILLAPGRTLANWLSEPDSATLTQSDHDFFAPGATFDGVGTPSLTLAQWQASGFDTHSLSGDPLFANPSEGDYSLQTGSPAIDAAPLEASLFATVPAPLDFAGAARLSGAAYDMGAYEHP